MASKKSIDELRDKVRRELLKRMLEDLENDEDAADLKAVAEAYAAITAPHLACSSGAEGDAETLGPPEAPPRSAHQTSAMPARRPDDGDRDSDVGINAGAYNDVASWDE